MQTTFRGFPPAGLDFLASLEKNNDRDWFNAHRQDYEQNLLQPAADFVTQLGLRLRSIAPGIAFDPATSGRGSILRLHRDIRFSKDKSPFHTYMRFLFWEGGGKKMENPGFFIGFDARSAKIHAGMHAFPKPMLQAYQQAVAGEQSGTELAAALAILGEDPRYEVGGDQYVRVPGGYDGEHPRADLLRYKALYVTTPEIPAGVITSADFLEVCFEHCVRMAPIFHWLVGVSRQAGA